MTTFPQGIDVGSEDAEIIRLHEAYISSVNQAVGADDLALADELAREYDADLRDLITQRATLAA